MELFQLPVVPDELAFAICKVAKADCHEVNKSPYTTATCSKKHDDTCAHLASIESVDAKTSAQKAKDQCYKPILAASIDINRFLRLADSTTTFYTYNSVVAEF
jgi:hypothetical protein